MGGGVFSCFCTRKTTYLDGVAHPFYEALLDKFCADTDLRPDDLRAWIEGRSVIKPVMADIFEKALGVPASAWDSSVTYPREEYPVPDGQDSMTPAQIRALRENGRRRRRYQSRVHDVLDRLGWNLKDLAKRLPSELGRPVSRASLQFFATGFRKTKTDPSAPSVITRVCAPKDLREAAQRLTAKEAAARRLGASGILAANAWPNVGSPTVKQNERLHDPPYDRAAVVR